tara:strand:+ start:589 stop:714 length:126 start_codon:yes stop_codon:yes gene_type:complete
MVEARKYERTHPMKKVKRLCKKFNLPAGMLKRSLVEGKKKK